MEEIQLGTTITAIKFAEGVIIAADSRTTIGQMIVNRVSDKLTKLYDKIWCCRSGSAAGKDNTQAIADVLRYYLSLYTIQNNQVPSVQIAANLASEICYQNKNFLSAGLIIAGYDQKKGGEVYSIPLGGSIHQQNIAIGGSGSSYIYGFCDKNFTPNMSKEEGIKFLKEAVSLAIKRDGSSGGVIRMVVITKDNIERLFFSQEDNTIPNL
ncbi:proteasome core particle subunit beta 1 [Pneumocystis jirovecii RU7]|uniref:proteasome endopeptidase complex n=1 Tax=Pneumocystis jirovecii (strain RU7) TaxID=1408657 RepID=A0A0W4ZUH7_PNEJ7|nr:proteasome core particle subunit beta 1 [Pneumocystis jirovecii RU7]KTW32021.1 hypothetical protein T551_00703 [Pneumocystis jirovecii RU7]